MRYRYAKQKLGKFDKVQKVEKPAAGGGAAGFKLDQQLGGGVLLIHI